MASFKVSGWTEEQIAEKKGAWEKDFPFSEQYCLAKIPRQPEDYTGPTRYCGSHDLGAGNRCKHHGGLSEPVLDNLEKLAAIKHGMYALDKHLEEDFSEKDQALYDWVTRTYPEAYDINVDDDVDPASKYDIHTLAIEMVRAERGQGYLLKEGEKYEQERYTDEGIVIRDDNGEIKTEESEHYLAGMMNRQRNLVMKIEKHLGIDRKNRLDRDDAASAQETMEGLAGSLGELIGGSEQSYNPEEFEHGDG